MRNDANAEELNSKTMTTRPKTVRTSISLSSKAKEQGEAILQKEGFTSFSDMVEYLIRRRTERTSVETAAA